MAVPSSSLLTLPVEIRLAIYDELFSSTTLAFSDATAAAAAENVHGRPQLTVHESPYPLGILYTCRTVYLEARHRWQDRVLYHFEGPQAMLEVLARRTKESSILRGWGGAYCCCRDPVGEPLLRSSL